MAFFSNSKQSDSQLRRKRSTSTPRDPPSRQPIDLKSTAEVSFHKRSPFVSALPSVSCITPGPHDPAPPPPTPVTAGLEFRSRAAGTSIAYPSLYDQSSTPFPFTKPTKRASPPPFSNLMIDVPSPCSVETELSSSHATVHHLDQRSKSSSRTAPSSPSASSPTPNASPVKYAHSPSEYLSGLISPSMPRVERQRPSFEQRRAAALPLKQPHSPTRTPISDTEQIALPTPVSPLQGGRAVRPESIPIPPGSPLGNLHSRSQSATNSPTTYTPGSRPGSAKSSVRRVPAPIVNARDASGAGSATASDKSAPSHEVAPSRLREKRPRNVLRKRSITEGTRRREPESAPTSDSERKTTTHRPRSRSVVFPRRRNSNSPILDSSQPVPAIPVPVTNLTPAKEILVAYKESHRDSFSRDVPLRNSGKIVAVGLEDDNYTSSSANIWSVGVISGRKDQGNSEKRNASEKSGGGVGILKRKLSGRWNNKELNRRRDDPTRSVSEGAAEVSARKVTHDTEANRTAVFSNVPRPSASPASGQSPGQERWLDQEEGHVWEENVGDWVGKHLHDAETEKDVSNSRRLWNLVKRLSSGNLRDKASPPSGPAPPVPPLPRDLSRKRVMSPNDAHNLHAAEMHIPQSAVPETPGGIRRFITSVPPLSIPRSDRVYVLGAKQAGVHHHHRSDLDLGEGMSPIPIRTNPTHRLGTTGTSPQMRRAATTRSSSPSSETTKFFSRSRSSSSSSYGDVITPPMPSIPTAHPGQNPSSPQRHSSHNDKSEDTVAVEHPPSTKPSTPSSPRTSNETSSTIPPFESYHPLNKFLPYRGNYPQPSPCTTFFLDSEPITPWTEQANLTNPPPIPKKNPRRLGHHSVSIPSLPEQRHFKPNVIPIQDESESEIADANPPRPRRLESGQTSTIPKSRPRSISDAAIATEPERYASTAKSTLTFREMSTTQRQLTEQEKNAKWEDLLQRSDKAGGTLRVGSPIMGDLGLWSDRSSVALSVAPSEASDPTD